VLIFCDFCGFISIAYTTLNKLRAVFLYNICGFTKKQFQNWIVLVGPISI